MTAVMPDSGYRVHPDDLPTLDALWTVYDRDGRATVRTVATELGIGVGTAHKRLLRIAGLNWCDMHPAGALRPLVREAMPR